MGEAHDLGWTFPESFFHSTIRSKQSFPYSFHSAPSWPWDACGGRTLLLQWEEAPDYQTSLPIVKSDSQRRKIPKSLWPLSPLPCLRSSNHKSFWVKFPKINQWKAKIIISTSFLFWINHLLAATSAKATSSIQYWEVRIFKIIQDPKQRTKTANQNNVELSSYINVTFFQPLYYNYTLNYRKQGMWLHLNMFAMILDKTSQRRTAQNSRASLPSSMAHGVSLTKIGAPLLLKTGEGTEKMDQSFSTSRGHRWGATPIIHPDCFPSLPLQTRGWHMKSDLTGPDSPG